MLTLSHIDNHLYYGSEICWAIEVNVIDSIFVSFDHTLKSVNLRTKDISVNGKTM